MEDDTNAVGLPLASPRLPSSATWKETWVNVGFPTFFGVAVGAGWQIAVQPRLTNEVPNPVQAALLALLLLTPFFHRWLTDHEPSRWKEYLAGASVLSTFFLLVWMTGYGALICGGYVAIVVWIWISTSWWRFHLPPFRSALWHTLGVNVGALAGSVLAFNLAG